MKSILPARRGGKHGGSHCGRAWILVHWQKGCLRCLSSLQRQQGRQPGVDQTCIWLHRVGQAERNTRKIFLQVPTEFALTLPHLVWGRRESGYYEHFLFIKLELQELICLLGKLAEYKAMSCPARTTCPCGRSPIASGSGSTSSTSEVAKASPWLVSKPRSWFFWPCRRAFLRNRAAFHICIAIVSLTWIWLALMQVAMKHSVFYHISPAAPFKGQALGWPFLRKQSTLQSLLHKGLPQQLNPLFMGSPILGSPSLLIPDGNNFETKISHCPMEKE